MTESCFVGAQPKSGPRRRFYHTPGSRVIFYRDRGGLVTGFRPQAFGLVSIHSTAAEAAQYWAWFKANPEAWDIRQDD